MKMLKFLSLFLKTEVIDIMNVKELNPLEPSQLNQRIAELKAMILNQDKPIYLTKEQNNEEKILNYINL